jgi:hypothetical protein
MKHLIVLLALPVISACVSIDLPGVVSDSAKVAKETYRFVTGKNDEHEGASSSTNLSESVSNTYIGQESQTLVDVKNLCVAEAAAKLFKASGKEVPYTVTQDTVSTVNNSIAATCTVKAIKITQAPPSEVPYRSAALNMATSRFTKHLEPFEHAA